MTTIFDRNPQLQKPGGRRLAVAEFLRGAGLSDGDRFELPG